MLDWTDLQFLAAFGVDGTLSGAGRRLGADHATVARRIAALESKSGVKLLDRRGRRLALTEAGCRILDHARRMDEEAQALTRALAAESGTLSGHFSLSAPPFFAATWLAPRMGPFLATHPRLTVALIGETRISSLGRGEADVVLRLGRPTEAALIARKAGHLDYRLYAKAEYLAAVPPPERRYLRFDPSLGNLPQDRWMMEIAGPEAGFAMTSNDLACLAAAAAGGAGIAVLPAFVAKRFALVEADPERRVFVRDVWIGWHEDWRGHPAIAAIVAFLATVVAEGVAAA
ncbi:LysR family transcriptional regulator [Rhizobium sp. YIM 134829]|uniref:LysR family transcriptional regulator n=1 Tax=Rhizobium sp. YIM 134829 TaxID=3390453 RepID=UPI00397DAA94